MDGPACIPAKTSTLQSRPGGGAGSLRSSAASRRLSCAEAAPRVRFSSFATRVLRARVSAWTLAQNIGSARASKGCRRFLLASRERRRTWMWDLG